MLIDIAILSVGVLMLVAGGEALVRGASALARNIGVSELAIGLTVVAFGTSAPELAVNISASLTDSGALSFGNIFGSNMANIGLIVGLSAVLVPLPIKSIVIQRELPMMVIAMFAAMAMSFDIDLGEKRDVFTRSDALVLLLFFVIFLFYTVRDLSSQRQDGNGGERGEESTGATVGGNEVGEDAKHLDRGRLFSDTLLIVAGLAGLILGAELTVTSAVSIAHTLGVPEVIIGLTMVSIGTSMPELATALVAIYRKQIDLAIGGVVGSNIFNTLLVAGATALIRPMEVPEHGHYDLIGCAVLSVMLWIMAGTNRNTIIRYEGVVLIVFYVCYLTWRTVIL